MCTDREQKKKDMCALKNKKKKSGFRGAISRHDDRYLFIFNKDFIFCSVDIWLRVYIYSEKYISKQGRLFKEIVYNLIPHC